ncbi:hypothetical protein [Candidatus Sneabacter namystus]|uniref:Uncharacterized protein n=1 Tax=Candidatus Sneabacter namystus TaxID=2601646 RepID=A0A5C0UI30_9RICK|nr:hypothetical protein [Candidatus Sneabacter namystus]QEK39758.1 hypothetical protein FZC37_02365 [Candidatus Sneabacter namystus]
MPSEELKQRLGKPFSYDIFQKVVRNNIVHSVPFEEMNNPFASAHYTQNRYKGFATDGHKSWTLDIDDAEDSDETQNIDVLQEPNSPHFCLTIRAYDKCKPWLHNSKCVCNFLHREHQKGYMFEVVDVQNHVYNNSEYNTGGKYETADRFSINALLEDILCRWQREFPQNKVTAISAKNVCDETSDTSYVRDTFARGGDYNISTLENTFRENNVPRIMLALFKKIHGENARVHLSLGTLNSGEVDRDYFIMDCGWCEII